ncbi:MAG: type II toxin-antitoxin system Phd/YefM family antitoxin [bacterium]
MQTMTITAFKAQALRKIGLVASNKEPITITRRGLPVVRIVPWKPKTAADTFGKLAGSLLFEGDLLSPAVEASEFEACR